MQAVSLAHAKAHLGELLNTVESGEEVTITRHGQPVVRVVPAPSAKQALPCEFDTVVNAGVKHHFNHAFDVTIHWR